MRARDTCSPLPHEGNLRTESATGRCRASVPGERTTPAGRIVYVLPGTRPAREVFASYDADEQALHRAASQALSAQVMDASAFHAPRQKKPYNASNMRYSTIAAMLALMAGCAQMEWLKPDTEPATRNEDLARCEQQARLTASRMSPSASASIPSVSVSQNGSASVQMPPPYVPRDLTLEMDFLASCMQEKGYRLIPAESAAGH